MNDPAADNMHMNELDRRALVRLAAAGAAMLIPDVSQAQTAERIGLVEDVKGEAFAQGRLERRLLDRAAPVFINEMIETGVDARLRLRLGKDTTVLVGQKARLTIDRFLANAGGEITLESGPILYDRPAGAAPARMQIRSSFGLIAVRGTRFFAGPSAGVFGVFVQYGAVVVSAAGSRVSLRAGQGTNIAQPGSAPTPAAIWKPARVQAALDSVA
ncbi:FecR family protein [Methylocapsa aurea]|uniref:FecR family protein n=1 Tax=Methylocapsa aurea TaxID=663610 RepID=UPI000A6ACF31|nr:FecR family protein [Methylocapsa aurea]